MSAQGGSLIRLEGPVRRRDAWWDTPAGTVARIPRPAAVTVRITVCVLETVSVGRAGAPPVPVGALQQKILLTLLVAYRGQAVSVDRIAEELWGDHRPRRWLPSIRTLANSLRRIAGDRAFVYWTGRGYRLHKDRDAVETDIDRMVHATDEARAALDDGRFPDAEAAARRALAVYGGGPWTTDCWHWADIAAEAYCLLGRALICTGSHLRCLVELSRAPEEIRWHLAVSDCLERARDAVAATAPAP